jgi:hypothetical protein
MGQQKEKCQRPMSQKFGLFTPVVAPSEFPSWNGKWDTCWHQECWRFTPINANQFRVNKTDPLHTVQLFLRLQLSDLFISNTNSSYSLFDKMGGWIKKLNNALKKIDPTNKNSAVRKEAARFDNSVLQPLWEQAAWFDFPVDVAAVARAYI